MIVFGIIYKTLSLHQLADPNAIKEQLLHSRFLDLTNIGEEGIGNFVKLNISEFSHGMSLRCIRLSSLNSAKFVLCEVRYILDHFSRSDGNKTLTGPD